MKTILVIEDNEAIGETTVELLEFFGFRVLLAPDGDSGLTLIDATNPDLILCDILMPGLDGYNVLRRLRTNSHFTQVPFYFVTALSEPIEQKKGLFLGATGYLIKPYLEEDLLNCIGQHFPLPANK